jgi:hypothetical protein
LYQVEIALIGTMVLSPSTPAAAAALPSVPS